LRRIVNPKTPSDAAIEAAVQAALSAWPPDPTHTLQVLRETQERLGWLPEAALERVAASLGVSIATVRRWSNAGYLDGYRTPGGQRRFTQEQLDSFLESLKPGVRPPGGTRR